uniref:Uncharacterized protein n=1 Tax=Alexandrium catenella TaxID=2925 RepID=A0A7S1RGU8_ALECA
MDHYAPRLVHGKLCPALALRLGQLQGPSAFAQLAELVHGLSLLPAQSHKSSELALSALAALRRHGAPQGWVEPHTVALVAAALAQLGQVDEQLGDILAACVLGGAAQGGERRTESVGPRGPGGLLHLASEEELQDLQRALKLHQGVPSLIDSSRAIGEELARRGAER